MMWFDVGFRINVLLAKVKIVSWEI